MSLLLKSTSLRNRLYNLLVWVDEGVNTLFGGLPFETVSGTIWRAQPKYRWALVVVDGLFGKDHCKIQAEKEAKARAAFESEPSA